MLAYIEPKNTLSFRLIQLLKKQTAKARNKLAQLPPTLQHFDKAQNSGYT